MILSSRFELLLEFCHPVDELGGEMLGVLRQAVFVLLDRRPTLEQFDIEPRVEQIAEIGPELHQGRFEVSAGSGLATGQIFEVGDGVSQFLENRRFVKRVLV